LKERRFKKKMNKMILLKSQMLLLKKIKKLNKEIFQSKILLF